MHESTHVLQQAGGPVSGSETPDGALAISDPGDSFERAASSTAGGGTPAVPTGDGRSVQRDLDVDDLLGYAKQSQEGPGPLGGMIESFSGAIGDDASSGNLGMGTLQKAAFAEQAREKQKGADLRTSQKGFESFVDSTTKGFGDWAKETGKDSGTGAVGEGIGNYADSAGRFTGGFAKELWGMGSGLESMVANPLGFQKAQAEKASKEGVPLATNQYFESLGKVGRGEEGLGDAAGEIFDAFSKGKDNELKAKEDAAQPIVDDINKGDYAGALGHVGAQIGVAVLSLGEEGPLGELGAEASAGEKAAASEVGQGGRAAGELSPAAKSVPAPKVQLEPPISPAAESVPNPQLRPLEPPISPLADSVPGGVPDTQPGLPPTERGLPPTERGLPPTERGLPPTERGLPPTERGEPPTLRDPPRTFPGIGPEEGPVTLPGLARRVRR